MAITPRNQIVPRAEQKPGVINDNGQKATTFLTSTAVQNLYLRLFNGDQRQAARLVAITLAIVTGNEKLQECPPMEIMACVLRGEYGAGLSYANNEYAIVPYNGHAQFQVQWQGLAQMAFASGAFLDSDVYDVREGEYRGLDRVTRQPIIVWNENDAERENLPIVGYYAYYELVDKPPYFGRKRGEYMSHDAILNHANRYSRAFSLEKYKALMSGKITGWDAEKLRNGSPWYGDPKSLGHIKMCKKTVLKQLLKKPGTPRGVVVDNGIALDDEIEKSDGPVIYGDEYDSMAKEAALEAVKEGIPLQASTETTAPAVKAAPVQNQEPEEKPAPEIVRPNPLPKRGRPPKEKPIQPPAPKEIASVPAQPAEDEEDYSDFDTSSFFDET